MPVDGRWACRRGGGGGYATPAAQAATTFRGFEMTWTAPDSRQWFIGPNGNADTSPSALAPNEPVPTLLPQVSGGWQEEPWRPAAGPEG